MYRTIDKDVLGIEILRKKSKFIANIFYVSNEADAIEKIQYIKNKYSDAKHNVLAYRILDKQNVIDRYSDDGEPSKTAGAPILEILQRKFIVNVVIIVTRYFGGILLGTGGLIRAYSDIAIKAIEMADFVEEEPGEIIKIKIQYKDVDNLKYYCDKNKINIIKEYYTDNAEFNIELTDDEKQGFMQNTNIQLLEFVIIGEKNIRKHIGNTGKKEET